MLPANSELKRLMDRRSGKQPRYLRLDTFNCVIWVKVWCWVVVFFFSSGRESVVNKSLIFSNLFFPPKPAPLLPPLDLHSGRSEGRQAAASRTPGPCPALRARAAPPAPGATCAGGRRASCAPRLSPRYWAPAPPPPGTTRPSPGLPAAFFFVPPPPPGVPNPRVRGPGGGERTHGSSTPTPNSNSETWSRLSSKLGVWGGSVWFWGLGWWVWGGVFWEAEIERTTARKGEHTKSSSLPRSHLACSVGTRLEETGGSVIMQITKRATFNAGVAIFDLSPENGLFWCARCFFFIYSPPPPPLSVWLL